ncbi:MAG: hypothetical protein ACPGJS_16195 [Flammeovirgaceae bacterium]
MDNIDDELTKFFTEMREADEKHTIPPFEAFSRKDLKPKSKRKYLIPMGIAASLLLLLGVYLNEQTTVETPVMEEVSIQFVEPEEMNTQSLITDDEPSIYAWEAPTNVLIDEFQ